MKLKRLRDVLNKIEDKDYEVETEEIVGRGEELNFQHHLVIFNKIEKQVVIKLNLNRNQIYYTNGSRGKKFIGI